MNIKPIRLTSKAEFAHYYSKLSKFLLSGANLYLIGPNSIEMCESINYSVEVPTDGVFDIICIDCNTNLRIFTFGSTAYIQIAKCERIKHYEDKSLGRFIPSPLAPFIVKMKNNCDDCSENEAENADDELFEKPSFDETVDDDEFDFMFSNAVAPFVGGFREQVSLIYA